MNELAQQLTDGESCLLVTMVSSSDCCLGEDDIGSVRSDAATDVWWFFRPLESDKKPETLPDDGPILRSRPKSPFAGCKLCGLK